jgi:heptosyltransferase III
LKQLPRNIIISRTDSIGDVVLTLPVAKVLKDHFPQIQIAFLGKAYTRPVIEACEYIDTFIGLEDFNAGPVTINGQKPEAILHVFPVAAIAKRAKQLGIPLRIGTTNRLYHWTTCNKLIRLSRKKSSLHEAQLNLKLLATLGIEKDFSLQEIGHFFGLTKLQTIQPEFASLIDPGKYNLILHPKSQGSAREWGLDNFIALIRSLDLNRFKVFISGTEKERALIAPVFEAVGDKVTDITGMMNLSQFIAFINVCDGLVANSTGPLHIAAALGKDAYGIYPPMRPIHPGRWAPLGDHVSVFVLDKDCEDCRKAPESCHCIRAIKALEIKAAIEQNAAKKF